MDRVTFEREIFLRLLSNPEQCNDVPNWFMPYTPLPRIKPEDYFQNQEDIDLAKSWARDPCFDLDIKHPRTEEFVKAVDDRAIHNRERAVAHASQRLGIWLKRKAEQIATSYIAG